MKSSMPAVWPRPQVGPAGPARCESATMGSRWKVGSEVDASAPAVIMATRRIAAACRDRRAARAGQPASSGSGVPRPGVASNCNVDQVSVQRGRELALPSSTRRWSIMSFDAFAGACGWGCGPRKRSARGHHTVGWRRA